MSLSSRIVIKARAQHINFLSGKDCTAQFLRAFTFSPISVVNPRTDRDAFARHCRFLFR
jgi:hypothetical protein